MKNVIIISTIVVMFSFISCGDNNSPKNTDITKSSKLPATVQNAIDASKSTMNQELKDILSFMGNEERLAYDIYNTLYEKFPDVKQLYNIPTKSEYKHLTAVQLLVRKYIDNDTDFSNIDLPPLKYKDTNISQMKAGVYDIKVIQDLYDQLYTKGVKSKQDALEVGCIVEVTDINDLDIRINTANSAGAEDIEIVLNYLRDGSYNHYWAFDKGLKNLGITDGCCSLGTIDGIDYCNKNYPKK